MSKHVKHVPKHRGKPSRPAVGDAPRKVVGTTVLFSSVAVAATGTTVGVGVLGLAPAGVSTAASADVPRPTASSSSDAPTSSTEAEPGEVSQDPAGLVEAATGGLTTIDRGGRPRAADASSFTRSATLSRSSDRRAAADPEKVAALSETDGNAVTGSENLADSDPRTVAQALLPEFGFSSDQFSCLDSLYNRESGWNVYADNPSSSAYGIPQALPGSKMASAGSDWATNPVTQIRWGLGYIADRYGSPCGAWGHSESYGWY